KSEQPPSRLAAAVKRGTWVTGVSGFSILAFQASGAGSSPAWPSMSSIGQQWSEYFRSLTWNMFVFGVDGVNHAVVSVATKIKRDRPGGVLAICAARIPPDAPLRSERSVISCEACLQRTTSFFDLIDRLHGG